MESLRRIRAFAEITPIAKALVLILVVASACGPQPVLRETLGAATTAVTPTFVMLSPSETPGSWVPTATTHRIASADEARGIILNLLGPESTCRPPCLLGFDPSTSSPADISSFLGGFLPAYDSPEFSGGFSSQGAILDFFEGDTRVAMEFGYYTEGQSLHHISLGSEAGQITDAGQDLTLLQLTGSPFYKRILEPYLLSSILTMHGVPTQILVAPFPRVPEEPEDQWVPFSVALIYEDEGFAVEYAAPRRVKGSQFLWCAPEIVDRLRVWAWSPSQTPGLPSVLEPRGVRLSGSRLSYYKSLEDATQMTVDQFVAAFSAEDSTACIGTPTSLWPEHE